ncbi:MAG: hypothetical protein COY69_02015 [Candidatus Magasanikbacteria bacterium CG_4_10_14_0_8_um_filter_32_14]|uniref:Uncharacterized protein n=1 Tax=Candidatus Magasanikbacteria bacterium CG_4_10_14_0_8_um_filter_32_14 TaxID=1974640 RepID=A0A2M7R9P4_9BACT|nr:MAG: hypothetical protein COY69_02015 [Candidatus Magasanikbacteria bacterium CG_4_10_14_0_8_um_filter_32_14]
MRNVILFVGWPILVVGSVFIFIKGKGVYGLVKGSLIGKISKTLVYTMLVEMYSLGIVATFFLYYSLKIALYVVIPVFIVWFINFVVAVKVLTYATDEAKKMAGSN